MSSAFFYRERKMTFVVLSLAGWFGILGLFGPYLPANVKATDRQITFKLHGNQLTGHWTKREGRWHFLKISKISRPAGARSRRLATVKKPRTTNGSRDSLQFGALKAPTTTASLAPSTQRRNSKKAQRAALAEEIGRWAKIDNRWQWQAADKPSKTARAARATRTPAQSKQPRQSLVPAPKEGLKQTDGPVGSQSEPYWVREDGRWRYELVAEHMILRQI